MVTVGMVNPIKQIKVGKGNTNSDYEIRSKAMPIGMSTRDVYRDVNGSKQDGHCIPRLHLQNF